MQVGFFNMSAMKTLRILSLLLATAVSGCVTMDSSTETSRQNLEITNLKASVESLDRAVRDSDAALQKILQDLESIKGTSRADSQRIAELEIQAKNAAQANEQMRKDIIADLSKRMSEVMKAYYQTTPSRSSRQSATPVSTGAVVQSEKERGSESGNTGEGSQSGSREHVVAAGQSITKIASIYGVSVNAIMSANNISNPNLIKSGQKLIIPR